MIQHWVALACGEVKISVKGSSLPRFLNLCAQHRIRLYHLRRCNLCMLTACLSVRDFKRLRLYMGRTGCRVHIVERRGLPFLLRKLRGRGVLWMGAVGLCALFFVLRNFLWVVDLQVQAGIPADALRQRLDELGVHAGAWVHNLDEDALRLTILQEFDEVSALAIAQFGNSIRLEAYARQPAPVSFDEDAVTGLVATCEGVLTRMTVTGGQALHRVGDAVAQGEWLVSPEMPPTQAEALPTIVHGMGEIWATTWHEQDFCRPQTHEVKQYTDKTTTQYALVFGDKRINLYFGCGIVGGTCDKIVSKMRLHLGQTLQLPACLVTQTYRYYETTTVTDDPQTVAEGLSAHAVAYMTDTLDGQVLEQAHTLTAQDDALHLTQTLTCEQQIAEEALWTDADEPLAP